MKNLKTLVHTAHSELKKAIPKIKKSHLYEAIASYCDFQSYAAFQASCSFDKTQITDDEIAKRRCFDRMGELGFDAADALVASQYLTTLQDGLCELSLDGIWQFYLSTSYEERLASPSILETIMSLVQKGDLQAKLIGLVLATEVLAEYQEDPDNRSGEYWHKKRLINQKLNDLQAEVADNYSNTQCYREFLDFLWSDLLNSGPLVLPSVDVIKAYTNKFNESTKREWTSFYSENPYLVIEAFNYIQHYKDTDHVVISHDLYFDWYKAVVILNPHKEMLAEIIENSVSDNEKWFWYFFGLTHDLDVTQDAHIAIHGYTGEEWDGYGPMEAGGYDGISLPQISASSKAEMKKAVISAMS